MMREAVCVLRNAMLHGTNDQRTVFFNEGFVPAFVACLKHSGSCAETDQMALEGLELLMEHGTTLSGSGDNPCVSAAVDAGIVDALRSCASNGRDVMAFAKKWFPLASELSPGLACRRALPKLADGEGAQGTHSLHFVRPGELSLKIASESGNPGKA
eukprot:TRINITY_DN1483_c0_g1_i9.p1 TRINITY_DN1483_c0_g1~~TRINITY_DN1483_c0_g1_i9.p1  ORF type:complete len:164 (+),score=3.26 TRINITY_DN1483_c0_g1_i9:24-494(+)